MNETPPPPKRRVSGVVKPEQVTLRGQLAAGAIYSLIQGASMTWRTRIDDRSGLLRAPAKNTPCIFAIWHNRLALCMQFWRYVSRQNREAKLAALISASRDGGLLTRTLGHFGVHAVRGSSSRRGPQALLELTKILEKGYSVAITPDGPRGPKYQVQDGIIALAQISGAPIIPVGAQVSSKIQLRSWDNFQIPVPFAKCDLTFAEPHWVPPEADRPQSATTLRTRLLDLNPD